MPQTAAKSGPGGKPRWPHFALCSRRTPAWCLDVPGLCRPWRCSHVSASWSHTGPSGLSSDNSKHWQVIEVELDRKFWDFFFNSHANVVTKCTKPYIQFRLALACSAGIVTIHTFTTIWFNYLCFQALGQKVQIIFFISYLFKISCKGRKIRPYCYCLLTLLVSNVFGLWTSHLLAKLWSSELKSVLR